MKSTADYTAIDSAICIEIAAGRNAAHHLVNLTNDMTRPLWHKYDNNGMRVVDRRLQAMKKAGKISYTRATGWVVINAATAQQAKGGE